MTVLLATLAPPADRWRLRRDGGDWLLEAGAEHARLRDGRGLHYLRALLAAPGHDIPALDLAAGGAGVHSLATGPVIDEQARSAYRRRLTPLAGELDAADRAGDADRGGRLEAERQALLAELRRATGLAWRSRDSSPAAERARVNVTRTLRATLARITETAPAAGAHLQASIRTGRACRYQPEAGGPAGWDVCTTCSMTIYASGVRPRRHPTMTAPKPASRPPAAAAAGTVPAPRARRRRFSAVNGIARQFGGPSGPIGHLVTRRLARGNASFNRWLVHELGTVVRPPSTVVELGCGPGIALRELLTAYPAASVVGVDPSSVVLKSARRRNTPAIAGGRLTLVTGDIEKAVAYTPAELVLACHVLYFWADPVSELRRINDILAPHGHVALGYQLRQHIPPVAQRTFPQEGFTLYDRDDQVAAALQHAGFTPPEVRVFGDPAHPGGRLALATPAPGR